MTTSFVIHYPTKCLTPGYTSAAPTNAHVRKITEAIGPNSLGYYFGSGQPVLMTNYDYDSQTTNSK